MSSNVNLRSILDTNKLTRPNFLDLLRNSRIVLKENRITYVLDGPLPESPTINASNEDQRAYQKHMDDSEIDGCILLAYMYLKL